MEIYQKTQKSESKLINNIKETFKLKNEYGNDLILVFGDWSDEPGHKTGETTINKNLKRKLSKHFKNCYLIDEYNTSKLAGIAGQFTSREQNAFKGVLFCTSKLCCKYGNKLKNLNNKHSLLIYKNCRLNKNQYSYKYYDLNVECIKQEPTVKDRIFTRDLNSCLNMIRLAEHIINRSKKDINLGREARKKMINLTIIMKVRIILLILNTRLVKAL